eukprot:2000203-Alexandrium_andersonii.AAC.1
MVGEDLHRNPKWTELKDFLLEQRVAYFGKPSRIKVDSDGSWMSEEAAIFFGKQSIVMDPIPGQAHWQSGL